MRAAFIIISLIITTLAKAEIVMESYGSGAKEYWIIYDDAVEHSENLVVFLHGHGANNPVCYGGWIRDIAENGHVVVFPKFQTGVWIPRTKAFQRRVDKVISRSKSKLKKKDIPVNGISFVSHSLGGIISANLTDAYGINKKHKVTNMVLVQPGFKYLKLQEMPYYPNIPPETKLLIITATDDLVAGEAFASRLMATTEQVQDKVMVRHFKTKVHGKTLSATHKDPVSPLITLDSKNRNPVVLGALKLGKTDEIDKNVYWKLTNFSLSCEDNCHLLFDKEIETLNIWDEEVVLPDMSVLH